jgi:hypothetical protein
MVIVAQLSFQEVLISDLLLFTQLRACVVTNGFSRGSVNKVS